MAKKIIVNLTPTGMIPTREMTPYVPITPKEIIEAVIQSADIGANLVHLHARDESGKPTYKKEIYGQIIAGIRKERPDLALGVSCSGRDFNEFEKRSEVLELKGILRPDLASLTLSSLNFSKVASVNAPDMIIKLAKKMQQMGIKPELEVFDVGMVNYAKYMIKKGLIEPPYYFNIILGNIACAQAKLSHLGLIIGELPPESIFTVGGIGDFQHNINVCGLMFGAGVRVGLEDNIYLDRERKVLARNSELVERIVSYINLLEFEVASPAEVRLMLGLK